MTSAQLIGVAIMSNNPSKPRPKAPFWLSVSGLALVLFAPIPAFLRHQEWSAISADGAILAALAVTFASLLFLIPGSRRRLGLSAIYAFAILFFVDFQFRPLETWLVFAGAYAVILALCFVLFPKLPELTTFVFGLMTILTLISIPYGRVAVIVGDQELPPIVYLILDEHIGVAGIPATDRGSQTKEFLRNEYTRRGFQLYENAYSLHDLTHHSVASILNGTDRTKGLVARGKSAQWVVQKSTLLRLWAAQGYRLRVYQSDWLDLCSAEKVEIDSCYTYSVWSLAGLLEGLPWYSLKRSTGILAVMTKRSRVFLKSQSWYDKFVESAPATWNVPRWREQVRRPGALAVRSAVRSLRHDAAQNARGQVFFAHLLHPHYPYVYNADCSVKPKTEWTAAAWNRRGKIADRRRTRMENYPPYLEQVECATREVGQLIDEMRQRSEFHDATFVVHSDHGSRLWVKRPRNRNRPRERDLIDSFSAHLAISSPAVASGINTEAVSINRVLANHWGLPLVLQDGPGLYSRPYKDRFPSRQLPLPSIWRHTEPATITKSSQVHPTTQGN